MAPKETVDVNVDLPIQAFLPRDYVSDLRLKIDLYRRLARITREDQLDEFATELADRFGPTPPQVEQLLALARLRVRAHNWGVADIHLEDNYVVLMYTQRPKIEQLAARSRKQLRVVDGKSAYLPLKNALPENETGNTTSLLELLISLLRPT
jgi:transcription-repair coupling factor (superfamily II helicase)